MKYLVGTWDLGVLTNDETSPLFSIGNANSTRPGWMPPQEIFGWPIYGDKIEYIKF